SELLHIDRDRPIIGYYGAIADWFDAALVGVLARARPNWQFILIGSTFGCDLRPLNGQANLHLLGEKPYPALPAFLHAFDIAIIPFKKLPLTEATNPVKLFEYLSAGKRVVATDLAELRQYRDYVALATGPSEWLDALSDAMQPQDAGEIQRRL